MVESSQDGVSHNTGHFALAARHPPVSLSCPVRTSTFRRSPRKKHGLLRLSQNATTQPTYPYRRASQGDGSGSRSLRRRGGEAGLCQAGTSSDRGTCRVDETARVVDLSTHFLARPDIDSSIQEFGPPSKKGGVIRNELVKVACSARRRVRRAAVPGRHPPGARLGGVRRSCRCMTDPRCKNLEFQRV